MYTHSLTSKHSLGHTSRYWTHAKCINMQEYTHTYIYTSLNTHMYTAIIQMASPKWHNRQKMVYMEMYQTDMVQPRVHNIARGGMNSLGTNDDSIRKSQLVIKYWWILTRANWKHLAKFGISQPNKCSVLILSVTLWPYLQDKANFFLNEETVIFSYKCPLVYM